MQKILVFLLLALPICVIAQNKLKVSVEGVPSSKGNINVGLYNSSDGFLIADKAMTGKIVRAIEGTTEIEMDDLPNGTYAVAIFYDENGNEKLDTNFLGIPKEKIAFSNAKMKMFGPPGFEECSFKINGNQEMKISL